MPSLRAGASRHTQTHTHAPARSAVAGRLLPACHYIARRARRDRCELPATPRPIISQNTKLHTHTRSLPPLTAPLLSAPALSTSALSPALPSHTRTLPPVRMMLSTISHSMPPTYRPRDPLTMTTSLPLIPHPAALPQRPKLSLDTQQSRTFGKGSTSLRLDTLSAVSPTVRNTFSNAYEAPAAGTPAARPSRPRLCIDSSCDPPSASTPSSASTLSSGLTSASTDSATIVIPYKQPHNLTSILSNSLARSLAPRKMTSSKPLFPAEKRVSFRTPLEEEITTVKYTVAHSELESSSSTISSLATTESEASEASISADSTASDVPSSPSVPSPSEQPASTFSSLESSPRPRGPRLGDKRDSSESDSDSCPETPVAGRRKRRRNWVWTLGPLSSGQSSSTSTSTSDATSEDSS